VVGRENVLVEALGIFGEGLVAAGAHFGEDVRNGARHVFRALTPVVDQSLELRFEVGVGCRQAKHQAAFASTSERKRSTRPATRGSVLSAARLTIRRAEI